jgi:hypothetical protein
VLPFYPKQATGGVTNVADSLYDDPISLSLGCRMAIKQLLKKFNFLYKKMHMINCTLPNFTQIYSYNVAILL